MSFVSAPAITRLAEPAKILAFVRREFMVLKSYRFAMVGDVLNLILQAVSFYFVSLLVNPDRMPFYGGTRASYMGFVLIGIAFGGFLQIGLSKIVAAIRNEQLMGTLELLFMTPTRPITLQLGLVAFDLVYVPIRTSLFLAGTAVTFGVGFHASGIAVALAVLAFFIPSVWGLGMISAAAILTFRRGNSLLGVGSFGLVMVSGAYFPLHLLPSWLQQLAALNPIAVAFETSRAALLGGIGWSDLIGDVLVLAPMAVLSLALGLVAFSAALARERRLGTLGMY